MLAEIYGKLTPHLPFGPSGRCSYNFWVASQWVGWLRILNWCTWTLPVLVQHSTPWLRLRKAGYVHEAEKKLKTLFKKEKRKLTSRVMRNMYSESQRSLLCMSNPSLWDSAAASRPSRVKSNATQVSRNTFLNNSPFRTCLKASWIIVCIVGRWTVSITFFVPGKNRRFVSVGHPDWTGSGATVLLDGPLLPTCGPCHQLGQRRWNVLTELDVGVESSWSHWGRYRRSCNLKHQEIRKGILTTIVAASVALDEFLVAGSPSWGSSSQSSSDSTSVSPSLLSVRW